MARFLMRSTVIVPRTVAVLEGGQTVAQGAVVDLPETYGDHLVAEKLALPAPDIGPTEIDPERLDLVAGIISELPADAFTKGGKPEVDAINAELPEEADPVTAAERNAIWDALQADDEE